MKRLATSTPLKLSFVGRHFDITVCSDDRMFREDKLSQLLLRGTQRRSRQ